MRVAKKTLENKLRWNYFPRSERLPAHLGDVINAFDSEMGEIGSAVQTGMSSNGVLAKVADGLAGLGYLVESGKKNHEKLQVPVLFGTNGKIEKYFDADAWHVELRTVVEVEAGRGYTNNQFLKDLFQASAMKDVDYCVVAVRNTYRDSPDFERVSVFMDTLYASETFRLPLKGILIIGY